MFYYAIRIFMLEIEANFVDTLNFANYGIITRTNKIKIPANFSSLITFVILQ